MAADWLARITPQDIDTLARTIWGESRGESPVGRIAVGLVILNRYIAGYRAAASVTAVCKDRYQFSCWLVSDPNLLKMNALTFADGSYRECYFASLSAINAAAALNDPTHGSKHYYAKSIPAPAWAAGHTPAAVIGSHLFFNDVK